MEIIEFLKSLWGISGIVLGFTIFVLIYGAYVSHKDGKTSDRIDKGVDKIDSIVTDSKKKLDTANNELQKNIVIASANLLSTEAANNKLLETNEKLNKTSLQLLQNYNKTLEVLEAANKAKDEALLAKTETIKSKDEIIGQMTGGKSFPRISLKKGGFHISVQGEYSLYNVKVIIRLIPNFFKIPKKTTQDYLNGLPIEGNYIIPLYQNTFPKLLAGNLPGSINIKDFNQYFTRNEGDMHAIDIYI